MDVEKLMKVFEAIKELGDTEKYYLMGYLVIPNDLEKLNKKVEDFLEVKVERTKRTEELRKKLKT